MKKLLEDDIKNAVLHYHNLLKYLGSFGDSKVIFEKAINYHKSIADALIFTENRGVIGIEIKTEADNLKRLERELDSYIVSCNYVFVFCHDKHLKDVLSIVNKYKYRDVGVISYDTFEGEPIAGLVKEAKISRYFSTKSLASILWKKELYTILQVWWAHQEEVVSNTYSIPKATSTQSRDLGYIRKSYNYATLLNIFYKTFNKKQGTKIICEVFIKNGYDPKKQLQQYHFNDDFTGDISYKKPYKGRHKKW